MKAKKQQWIKDIDEVSRQFNDAFSDLSAAELNLKPAPDKWSIAENIAHLIKLNESYYPVFKDVKLGISKIPFPGKFNFISSLMGNMMHKAVRSDRKNKVRTFAIWEPAASKIRTDILQKFHNHQQELKEKIQELSDEELNTTISSPANKFVVYKLHKAIDIIIEHERRHFEQAKEVFRHNISSASRGRNQ